MCLHQPGIYHPSIHVSIDPCIHLSMNLLIHVLLHPWVQLSECPSIMCLSTHVSLIHASINCAFYHPSIHVSIDPCIHPTKHPSIHASIKPCIHHPCIHLSIHLLIHAPIHPGVQVHLLIISMSLLIIHSSMHCAHPSIHPSSTWPLSPLR